jgi:CorA-like Mg2+ transporter protein
VTSCLQLAESYFKFDPYKKNTQSGSFRPYNTRQPPALLLLSWISVGLHHVLWRWQSAIEAVESEIKSSAQIVFLEDRSDLMADDPQFSLSKTYFWALQAYKLFEQTLLETISAWKTFRQDSLPRLRDPRVTAEEWNTSVQDIDDAIEQLEAKVARIRKRIGEVKDLRTGLISASALFDSRTAVRQGENIRLLTYITILFFPLSFATSIFGMQIMTPTSHAHTAFAISLPSITIGTALLVFNLEHILNFWTSLTENWATWLRHGMRQHRRKDWRERAIALHEDDELTRAPVRKAMRQSSGWVYLLFLLEYILVALPVGEIGAAMRAVGLLDRNVSGGQTHKRSASVKVENGDDNDQIGSGYTKQEMRERIKQRIEQSLEDEKRREKAKRYKERGSFRAVMLRSRKSSLKALKKTLAVAIDLLRALFIPLWMLLLSIEYMILVTALAFRPPRPPPIQPSSPNSAGEKRKSIFARAWEILGLSALLPLNKHATTNEKPEEEDFEFRAVNRVATLLGGTSMTSPRINTDPSMTTSPSMNSLKRNYYRSSTNLVSPVPKSNFNSPRQLNHPDTNTALPSMAQHAEDILSLPTKNTRSVSPAARKAQRAGRLARSGLNLNLNSQVEMQDMEDAFGGVKKH